MDSLYNPITGETVEFSKTDIPPTKVRYVRSLLPTGNHVGHANDLLSIKHGRRKSVGRYGDTGLRRFGKAAGDVSVDRKQGAKYGAGAGLGYTGYKLARGHKTLSEGVRVARAGGMSGGKARALVATSAGIAGGVNAGLGAGAGALIGGKRTVQKREGRRERGPVAGITGATLGGAAGTFGGGYAGAKYGDMSMGRMRNRAKGKGNYVRVGSEIAHLIAATGVGMGAGGLAGGTAGAYAGRGRKRAVAKSFEDLGDLSRQPGMINPGVQTSSWSHGTPNQNFAATAGRRGRKIS